MAEIKRLLPDDYITYTQIEDVNKTLNTTNIKGKEYVEVKERIKAFRKLYPTGTIQTEMISDINGVCVFRAVVGYYNEDATILKVLGTGTAKEKEKGSYINQTSYIENCETSAVGRALGMCGFGIDGGLASLEEINNAKEEQNEKTAKKIELMQSVLNLIEQTGVDLEALKEKRNIKSINDLSLEDLEKLEQKLIKCKEEQEKVK